MPQDPALVACLRDAWDAYGRGDLPAAHTHAALAHRMAPGDPEVRTLLLRLSPPASGAPMLSQAKVAIVFLVFEATLIAIALDAFGRVRSAGAGATMSFSRTGGDSALHVALGCAAAALVVPIVGWILVRATRG